MTPVSRSSFFLFLLAVSLVALALSIVYLNHVGFMPLNPQAFVEAIAEYGGEGLRRFGLTALSYSVLLWLSLCVLEVVGISIELLPERICAAVVVAGLASVAFLYVLGLPGLYKSLPTWVVLIAVALRLRRQHKVVWLRLASAASRFWHNPQLPEGASLLLLLLVLFVPALFLFQLTSPTIPFIDVLENHQAPTQQVISFGVFQPNANNPSAYYPQNRCYFGFVSLFSFLGISTEQSAMDVTTAFTTPQLILMLLSVFAFGRALADDRFGGLLVWVFILSFPFARMQDVRATVFANIYGFAAQAFFWTSMSQPARSKPRWDVIALCGLALGMTTLTHFLMGVYHATVFGLLACLLFISGKPVRSRISLVPIPIAAACGSLLLFPLTAYYAPRLLAQWTLFLAALAVSLAAAWALSRQLLRRPEGLELEDAQCPRALTAILVLGLLYFLLVNQYVFERNFVMPWFREMYPTLFAGVLAAIVILLFSLRAEAPIVRALGWNRVLPWTFAVTFVAVAACTVCAFFPPGSLVLRALKNDVSTKARDLWLTPMIAVALAFACWSLLRLADRLATPLRYLAFVPFLLLCIVPLSEGKDLDAYIERERKLSQQIMLDLSQATYGFWRWSASTPFEDPHRLVGPEDLRLYAKMKALIRSGKLTYKDEIVHIGWDHHLWVTTPFPAFTGIRQVFVLEDPQPYDFWTFEGRKYKFPDYFYQFKGVPKWILLEKKQVDELALFALKMNLNREFDSDRFALFSRP